RPKTGLSERRTRGVEQGEQGVPAHPQDIVVQCAAEAGQRQGGCGLHNPPLSPTGAPSRTPAVCPNSISRVYLRFITLLPHPHVHGMGFARTPKGLAASGVGRANSIGRACLPTCIRRCLLRSRPSRPSCSLLTMLSARWPITRSVA